MSNFKVGEVTHYYDKIGVAVVKLDGTLSVGDRVKFQRGGEDLFEQQVESIQVEHEKLSTAGKGDIIGLKTNEEAKEGTYIYKVE